MGRSPWHARLEERLARFEGQEAALLFPTGFAANLGTITALVERGDLVCSDRLNHASLIDGCRLSGAEVYVYDRDRLERLDARLLAAHDARRKLIVTDGVFSMDGVLAPLGKLSELAARHGAMLLVDEAHGTGVFGRHGRGVCEQLEVEDQVAVRVGTLSKAIGSLGGFVTGSRLLVDWLWNRARTQIFSTAAPPSACAAAYAALDLIEAEPKRREKVLALSQQLRRGIAERGLETVDGGTGPIVPILCNEPDAAVYFARRLEECGFLVGAMRPPSVPPGTSRVRIGVTAAHSEEDIVALLRRSKRFRGKCPTIGWHLTRAPLEGTAMVYLTREPECLTRTGFEAEYPFASHFFDLDGLRYHYIDEGTGPTLLMVHGNPTWSFAWRNLIKALAPRYRVVAVDHIGCGFSDKPQDYSYRLAQHVANLERFVTGLDLSEITLFAHDWGGAIGMGAAARCPNGSRGSCYSIRRPFARNEFRSGFRSAGFRASATWRSAG